MPLLFFKKKCPFKVTFATTCYEKDWKKVLLEENILEDMIDNCLYEFEKKMVVINNVDDIKAAEDAANKKLEKKVLTDVVVVSDIKKDFLNFFQLKRSDFKATASSNGYEGVDDDWIYYNALAPLAAIYSCRTDYLLYMTEDVKIEKPIRWIEKAISYLEKYPKCKVANLMWNNNKKEVKNESYKKDRFFFFSKSGFSDQMFLVKVKAFQKPIYNEIREDSQHFPRGDVFEKRVFSYLKNRGFERITYRKGYYTHEDTPCRRLAKPL